MRPVLTRVHNTLEAKKAHALGFFRGSSSLFNTRMHEAFYKLTLKDEKCG
jgi:hypothetical protein